MENFSNFFNDSNLHKEINDDELIKLANDNTYDILMGKITMNELFNKDMDVPLLVNPSEKIISNTTKLEILDGMLEYYIEEEEYEKCSKLLELKKKL